VVDVFRLGDDQAVALESIEGELGEGQRARAVVDRASRFATMCNHTATHLLHASLRQRLGPHVRQAGSYVGPDKLRFDFTHGERLSKQELAEVEAAVNAWIVENHPVRAVHTTRDEAERLGAMALFGEKYGDWVRMVDVDGVSRELCGGTHVASTAEIGVFHVTQETSSASNVRRIEALTAAGGIEEFRRRTEELRELAAILRVPEHEVVNAVRKLQASLKEATKGPKRAGPDPGQAEALAGRAEEIGGVRVVTEIVEAGEPKELLALSDQLRQKLGNSAVVLGAAADGRVHLVANFAPSVVERGLNAGDVIRIAAEVAGGGGGGRPNLAQAGGKDPGKLPDALAAARLEIEKHLA
jgi:alanyl-tRNA synthetase